MSGSPAQGLADNLQAQLVINDKKLPERIDESILAVSLERTIAGASTVTAIVRDPEKYLLQAGYFTKKNRSDLILDELAFRACNFQKKVDEYTLVFEDREVALLRKRTKPRKFSRAHFTRAQALKAMVSEVPHIRFHSPELDRRQPIRPAKETATEKKGKLRKGAVHGEIKIKGVLADPDQLNNIDTIMQVCDELKAPATAVVAIFEAAIQESSLHTHDSGGAGSDGVFQQTTATGQGTGISDFDTARLARYWLETGFFGKGGGIALARKGMKPGEIAQAVEGSEFPSLYEPHEGEAKAIIKAGGGVGEGHTSQEAEQRYTPQTLFERNGGEKKPGEEQEGTWECGERLAQEVGWRWFMRAGVVYFVSDETLAKSKPLMTLDDTSPGIIDIGWEIDSRNRVNPPVLRIECRAPTWVAPPGSVILLGEREGADLHEGIWLVSTILRRDITDNQTEITLERPQPTIEEEAKARVARAVQPAIAPKVGAPTTTRDGGVPPGSQQEGPQSIQLRLYQQCTWIYEQGYPYVFGGGHRSEGFGPSGDSGPVVAGAFKPGLDCSGAVSWALHSAGILAFRYEGKLVENTSALDTAGLGNWGDPGKGRFFTVWVNPSPGAAGHVYIEFTLPSGGGVFGPGGIHRDWEANGPPGTKVGFRPVRSNAGYTPRHWPGL